MFSLSRQVLKSSSSVINLLRMSTTPTYETLSVTVPKEFVYHVELSRPEKLNAMNRTMWLEIGKCFENLDTDEDCRVIVLSGAGKLFTAGLDLSDATQAEIIASSEDDVARRAKKLYDTITKYQDGITSLEKCRKPVIAAIHSACIGGGINIATAADMRYCTKDAWFQVKEVELGIAADVGVLQRLPKVIGSDSLARELCYTARKLHAAEALSCGLVQEVFEDKTQMLNKVLCVAEEIAKKSPVAVQGTKYALVYARDHTVQEGLDQQKLWNQAMLQSEDVRNAITAMLTKEKPVFSKL
ncbi:delta(3,5)-Delta(2,4)-dienoyl-CoA isomerase, mitochondrial [Aethina tumida]|uniref:delta(3,5)-Delta(2,4)-dienoyl-CoA isomerase, mitochondrial n=1 Tax=Aethina tumida TaxID=116153 RepID=UPI00096B0243|nr:delta(3,5)-Delta(2,4)-dienoyl-CoA isomerase, mitochondrial [Aethina tumida]